MKKNNAIFRSIIILIILFINFGFLKSQTVAYQVVFAERPPIDLNLVPADAYEPGILKIKLKSGSDGIIPVQGINAGERRFVITGHTGLDDLNQAFGVTQYKPLFAALYATGEKSSEFQERHKAWGLNLWFELILDERADIIAAIKQYSALQEVEFAEPEYRKRLVSDRLAKDSLGPLTISGEPSGMRWVANDPQYSNQWHYNNTGQQGGTPGADISLQEAWDIEKGNSNVIVAIIDGGIDYNHVDLAGNMWPGIGYNFVNGNTTILPHNHGTHVAGTVAAVSNNSVGVAGIAGGSGTNNGVRLMSCQVFTSSSNGGFHLAPIYAADNGASISQNSWSYTSPGVYDQSVLNAIDYFNTNGGGNAMSGGITFFAAGNDNSSGQWYPGCYSGSFAIAATNNQDIKAWYSNFDTWVEISAPGGETNSVTARGVLSTLTGNNYGYYQGTSMACPHASGVAALMVSLGYGQLTSAQVANIILTTTDNHYGVNPSYAGKLGTGRLNANAALLAVQTQISNVPNPQSFTATSVSMNQIALSWVKNQDNNPVMVVWSSNGIFGAPVDGVIYNTGTTLPGGGTVLYRGSLNDFNHKYLQPLTTYFYKAFSYNSTFEYSTGLATNATTLSGPFADFTANPTNPMVTMPVTFSDASGGGTFNSWFWDFGAGASPSTATGQGPHTVIYNSTGSKTVSLVVDQIYTVTKVNYITVTDLVYSASATYNSGNISTDYSFQSLPGSSSCPGSLAVSIPAGAQVTSVNVTYQMTALNNGWLSEQRSQLRCITPGGASETVLYSGTGNSTGTQQYSRTGLTIANGITGGGIIQFQLHAGRTWGGSGCNTTYNRVDNNTWTVTVNYSLNQIPVADFTASVTTIYAGESVSFSDLSTNSPTSWNWTFSGGTPANSLYQNPSAVYNTPGVYDVSLTVTNAFGTDTKTKTNFITVEVLPVPVADFTASATTIYAGESVSFSDLSTNSPTSWNWTFSGGTPANSLFQNPSVVYNTSGVYDVSLTVTNAFGTDTETKTNFITVEVLPLPVADFTASVTTIYAGESVNFSDLSSNSPTSWNWTFSGGTPANSLIQNPSAVYNTPGVYDVSLTVTNAFGTDTETKTNFITVEVLPLPVADFTASATTIYAGESVSFSDLSSNSPTSWNWTFSGGTPANSLFQNPTVAYNTPGVYDVSLTVTNAFGTDTETKTNFITVEVLPVPVADFTTSATTIYAGESVNFSDLSSNSPTSWNWTFSGGTPANSLYQNPSAVYNTPGIYDVSLTVTNAFGTDTETKTNFITVEVLPLPVADFTASATTIYAGESVSFSDLSTNSPTSWNWTFSGGTPVNSLFQNPSAVYNTPGVYDVSLTVANAFGTDTETKTDFITVEVLPLPVADFTASASTIYAGESVSFSDLSTNSPTSWNWTFSDGTPANSLFQNPSAVYNTPGVYDVSLTVTNNFGTDTETKTNFITVLAFNPVVADFTSDYTQVYKGDAVHFYDLSSGNPTFWKWEIQGGSPGIIYNQNPIVLFNTVGEFNVKLTVSGINGQSQIIREKYIEVLPVVSSYPPGWDFAITSIQHAIAVTLTSNPRVLDIPILPGDFIGAFYTDSFGNLKCGGATMWTGAENIAIIANGDQGFTPLKDGFQINEVFQFKIYSYAHGRDFEAIPTYDPLAPLQNKFYPMGLSALLDLYAGIRYELLIPAGWGGLSSPVMPYYAGFDDLFSDVIEDLTIIYDFNGIFWPGQNINSLYMWGNDGYTIKMENIAMVEFAGDAIKTRTHFVTSGTSYLPVPVLCQVSTAQIFAPHLNKLLLVRNILGTQVYWPMFGINTLPFLNPGNAYLVLASSPFLLTYPECQAKTGNIFEMPQPETQPELPWACNTPTPSVHIIAVAERATTSLLPGDIVGAFNAEGLCCGWVEYHDQNFTLPIYGNDVTLSNPNGFGQDEPLSLKLYRPVENKEYDLQIIWDNTMPNQGNFNAGGISAITGIGLNNENNSQTNTFERLNIFPNPGSGFFTISGTDQAERITITHTDGRLIEEISLDQEAVITINLSGQARGVYLLKVFDNKSVRTEKIILE